MLKLFTIIFSVSVVSLIANLPLRGADVPLTRIAFGSCAKQDKPQPIWDAVVELKHQIFVFLGDNIYGDSIDMEVLRSKYTLLANQPGFQKLKQSCPVVGYRHLVLCPGLLLRLLRGPALRRSELQVCRAWVVCLLRAAEASWKWRPVSNLPGS